jgi:hypothetical protein
MQSNITALIRTIDRPTLIHAIESAKREFGHVVVVADRVDLNVTNLPDEVIYLRNDNVIDSYGGAAINLGAQSCVTDYTCLLDDDDEYDFGAGEFMNNRISERPDIDIWIPGLRYNDGPTVCMTAGLQPGNVAVPTYKTLALRENTFTHETSPDPQYTDYHHVAKMVMAGYQVGWYEKDVYLVRPKLPGRHGVGQK